MLCRYVSWLSRRPNASGSAVMAEVYADDERSETVYPKFEQIYRGGVLADLQRWVPLARGVRERDATVVPGAVALFRRPSAARL